MRASRLRLNPAKTEVMWLGSYQQLKHVDVDDIPILSMQVKVAETARDLGVVLNSQLSLHHILLRFVKLDSFTSDNYVQLFDH